MGKETQDFIAAITRIAYRAIVVPNKDLFHPFVPELHHPPEHLNREQSLLGELSWRCAEITETLEIMRDIEVYVRRFPYGRTRITKTRHLIFNISSYLNEFYLLHERVESLVAWVAKKYRKDERPELQHLQDMTGRFRASASNVIETRGVHVHKKRYGDPELNRAATWELIAGDVPTYGRDAAFAADQLATIYSKERSDWTARIKRNNDTTEALLDPIFLAFRAVILKDQEEVRWPQHWPDA